MNKEIWKDIENYEGYYQVSNKGRVRSLDRKIKHSSGYINSYKGRILKPGINSNGYYVCVLSKNQKTSTKTVHGLVANAFIPNDYNKPQVNHIDGNKLNNQVCNLEWNTFSENQLHSYRLNLTPNIKSNNKYEIDLIIEIKKLIKKGYRNCEIVKILKVPKHLVSNVKTGKTWRHIEV